MSKDAVRKWVAAVRFWRRAQTHPSFPRPDVAGTSAARICRGRHC